MATIPDLPDNMHAAATRILSWAATITGLYALWRVLKVRIYAGFSIVMAAASISRAFGPGAGAKVRGVLEDLQRRMTMAEALSRAKERHLGLAMYVCDASGACISANPTLCELFGLSEAQMLGAGWIQAVDPAERIACDVAWKTSIERRIPYANEYHILRKGKRIKIYTEAAAVESAGAVICFIGFCKEAETP